VTEDRGRDEDLFQDFDEYFAPLEEGEWPEDERAEGSEGQETPEEEAAEDAALAAEARPDEGDEVVEPSDFDLDIPEPDELAADLPGEPEAPERPPDLAIPEPETEGLDAAFDEVEAELMAGAGAEEEAEDAAAEVEEQALEEELAEEELEGELAGEVETAGAAEGLSVDDLRAAPPQYADLPGPEEEAEAPAEMASAAEAEEPGEVSLEDLEELGEEEPVLAEEATFESLEGLPTAAELESAEPAEPPAEEAVEAAADHFAEGVRSHPEDVEKELLADLEAPADETVRIDAAGGAIPAPEDVEGGPTWEEGPATAIEEEEEPPAAEAGAPPPAGRNLVAAFVTGVALAVAVIVLLAIGEGPFAVFVGIVVLLGQGEFYAVLHARGYQPATLLGLVAGALILAGAYLNGEVAVPFGLFLAAALTVLWYMAAQPKARKGTVMNAGVTMLGVVYVPFLASFALLMLNLGEDGIGRNVFLTVVGLTILYDICAYAIGSLWGNRPLAPTVSPQKSWEGAIGATLVLLLVALAIVPTIDPFDPPKAIGLALVISIAAPLGDLVESAIKRDLGVKDMSTLLPGHGGILDRVDAILFAAPAAYYFLRLAFS
jgi:phosphatidate cytidylyltransferase